MSDRSDQTIPTGWTEERIEKLRDCYADGLSMSQIAKSLGSGATKNSVVSKIHRLGLPKRGAQIASKPQAERRTAPETPRLEIAPRLPVAPPPKPAITLQGDGSRLRDLGRCHCRWPIGDVPAGYGDEQEFCGKGFPDDDRRVLYCDAHRAASVIATNPRPPRVYEPQVLTRRRRPEEPASFAEWAA